MADLTPEGVKLRMKTLEVVRTEPEGVPLDSAPVVVASGAGAGCIEGWIGLETMIGQSGIMVNPELDIGIGLSGELQHMVGLVGAKVMVAINNDPKSPVFEQVDYKVEDYRQFVPILIEKLKQYKGNIQEI